MPALAPVQGGIKLVLGFTIGIDTTTGTHFYFSTDAGAANASQLNQLTEAAASGWNTHMTPECPGQIILTSVTGTDLSSPTGAVDEVFPNYPGSRAGSPLAANACVLINYQVARRYRGGKPRNYAPGGTSGDLANLQTWAAAFQSSYTTAWRNMTNEILAALRASFPGGRQVNISYYSGHQWLPDQHGNYHYVPTPRPTPVLDTIGPGTASLTVGSQRRRLRSV